MEVTPQDNIELRDTNSLFDRRKSRSYPNFMDLFLIFVIFVVSEVCAFLLGGEILQRVTIPMNDELYAGWLMFIAQLISMPLTIALISLVRASRKGQKIKIATALSGFNPTIILFGFVVMIAASIVIEPICDLFPPMPPMEARGLPLLLSVVVGAPIFEEILCRGVIFESLRAKSGVVVAWVVSSFFFGLMHLHPAMILNATIMGFILCYVYIRSRSIFALIILHAMNNALGYLFIVAGWEDLTMREFVGDDTLYFIIQAVATVVVSSALILSVRQVRRTAAARGKREEEGKLDNNL